MLNLDHWCCRSSFVSQELGGLSVFTSQITVQGWQRRSRGPQLEKQQADFRNASHFSCLIAKKCWRGMVYDGNPPVDWSESLLSATPHGTRIFPSGQRHGTQRSHLTWFWLNFEAAKRHANLNICYSTVDIRCIYIYHI